MRHSFHDKFVLCMNYLSKVSINVEVFFEPILTKYSVIAFLEPTLIKFKMPVIFECDVCVK